MPQPDPSSGQADSPREDVGPSGARRRLLRGIRLGMPIFLGYMPVGMAFGVLAHDLGFSATQAVVCSATALAGAGQFIALSLLKGGATAAATLIATSVVNLRYLLFSTTLTPHVRALSPLQQSWIAFTLTDETFAVNIADIRSGQSTPLSMAGVGVIAWTGWILGTLVGVTGAGWIGDPQKWGVDFAMPAMFAALFVALAEDRRHVLTGLVAGGIALVLPLARQVGLPIAPAWFIVIASLSGATIASVAFDDR